MKQKYFVGSYINPKYLVEIYDNGHVFIYTPDKISRSGNLDFYETYSLGKKILDVNYKNIKFIGKIRDYSKAGYNSKYIYAIVIKTNDFTLYINKDKIKYEQTY